MYTVLYVPIESEKGHKVEKQWCAKCKMYDDVIKISIYRCSLLVFGLLLQALLQRLLSNHRKEKNNNLQELC